VSTPREAPCVAVGEHLVTLWSVRFVAIGLSLASAFGFLNAFYLRRHGPGGDLGVVAGVLALVMWWVAVGWERKSGNSPR